VDNSCGNSGGWIVVPGFDDEDRTQGAGRGEGEER
jgi:hypothetical protein